jgi:hypothetical protein
VSPKLNVGLHAFDGPKAVSNVVGVRCSGLETGIWNRNSG